GYLYLSSCSDSWLAHCRANAESLACDLGLDGDSLVVELGSNDGYLLQFFRDLGVPALGVDPAPAPVAAARKRGIDTIGAPFTLALAQSRLRDVSADLVVSNNVLAHVADPHDFIQGVRAILAEGGTWVIEVPYVLDLVSACAFDTVYHEHLCYFSLTSLARLLKQHGFQVRDVERLPTHGGSLRVRAGRSGSPSERVRTMLDDEQRGGWLEIEPYHRFAQRACDIALELSGLLEDLAARGRSIAAYGAAAKGTILLNCLGPAARHVQFAADRNPLKHGKWIPGVNIPIVGVEEIARRAPETLLLLPWNLRQEVLQQQRGYLEQGGQVIVPLPRLEAIGVADL
ncbi:MAG: methyltransferase domain-containing protein, partial [Xanthomonadales bacterium]|nr:methyltransferase domain-containing protein [Xanthomonadales bacterium]